MITVQQLLRHRPGLPVISKDAMVYDAVVRMDQLQIGALLVMQDDTLLGIISERDYTRKVVLKDRSSKVTSVEAIMTRQVITVDHHCLVDECMKIMHQHNIRHIPVTQSGKVIGLLSILDVLGNLIVDRDVMLDQLVDYVDTQARQVTPQLRH